MIFANLCILFYLHFAQKKLFLGIGVVRSFCLSSISNDSIKAVCPIKHLLVKAGEQHFLCSALSVPLTKSTTLLLLKLSRSTNWDANHVLPRSCLPDQSKVLTNLKRSKVGVAIHLHPVHLRVNSHFRSANLALERVLPAWCSAQTGWDLCQWCPSC